MDSRGERRASETRRVGQASQCRPILFVQVCGAAQPSPGSAVHHRTHGMDGSALDNGYGYKVWTSGPQPGGGRRCRQSPRPRRGRPDDPANYNSLKVHVSDVQSTREEEEKKQGKKMVAIGTHVRALTRLSPTSHASPGHGSLVGLTCPFVAILAWVSLSILADVTVVRHCFLLSLTDLGKLGAVFPFFPMQPMWGYFTLFNRIFPSSLYAHLHSPTGCQPGTPWSRLCQLKVPLRFFAHCLLYVSLQCFEKVQAGDAPGASMGPLQQGEHTRTQIHKSILRQGKGTGRGRGASE